ncbi:TPA: hypothetical protein DEB29_03605 [Candidatus Wolfebacteria bacterium]|nr:hypothetical protein [Candidatus Wolfebacteria bacterium]
MSKKTQTRKKVDFVQADHTTSRNFGFKKGNVALNFQLRTDIKTDLKDFRECLTAAVDEVDREIAKQ